MISYAQAKEDVLLDRALRDVPAHAGFYIDVGANDPEIDSVTRSFYDRGWRGVNIEPSPDWFSRLVAQRPRDVNLQIAASEAAGSVVFHDIVGEQLGTMVDRFADRHVAAGKTRRSYTVDAVTLAQVCERHAPRDIHFLKVDVEGHEGEVLRGMDFTRFRPWILVIEATEPNDLSAATFADWDQDVIRAGYLFAFTDVLNRYYVAHEHAGLVRHFVVPPDDYVLASRLRHEQALEQRIRDAEERIATLERALESSQTRG